MNDTGKQNRNPSKKQLLEQIGSLQQQIQLERMLSGTYLEALGTMSSLVRDKSNLEYALNLNTRTLDELGIPFEDVQKKRVEIQTRDKKEQQEHQEEEERKAELRRSLDPTMHG